MSKTAQQSTVASVPIEKLTETLRKPEPAPRPTRRQAKNKQVELSPLHDFAGKLRQPEVVAQLKDYVRFQAEWRKQRAEGKTLDDLFDAMPDRAPLSINLDLTTACNYRCDHCVDMDILNTGIRYEHEKLKDSITELAARGLRTVIVIGGGEPTAYPKFDDIMRHMKGLGLKLGVVTNGSMLKKVLAIADIFERGDWLRLSLDSGSNDTFYRMHKPGNKRVTLDSICESVPPVKAANPDLQIGFSYIIVWQDCETNDAKIVENVDEIVMAAERAKQYRFDYISFKPFLTRAERNNAEVVDLTQDESRVDPIMAQIRERVDQAKQFENENFKVVESTNLRVLENGSYKNYTDQPRNCHMQFFRQVLSPLGVFNCPVYRHVPQARIGDKHSYATADDLKKNQIETLKLIEEFNAADECKQVTCLYNHANWFIEDLINHPEKLERLETSEERGDYFL